MSTLTLPRRPRLLDLFCCQGGAGTGYHRAGYAVYGVDITAQPRYPFPFLEMDALTVLRLLLEDERLPFTQPGGTVELLGLDDFDAIHASPPCQGYLNLGGVNRARGRTYQHQQLITETRALLEATCLPYVIENVQDARLELRDPVRICGTALGLPLRRHRLFESNVLLEGLACEHDRFTVPRYWTSWRPNGEHRLSTVVQVYGKAGGREHWPAALGIDWMDAAGMVQAVPPAYTQHIGTQLLACAGLTVAA